MSHYQKVNKKSFGVHFDAFNHPKRHNKNINKFEVTFDETSRKEYLTGFRARKQQRRKIAEEVHAKKERLERIDARKQRKEHMRSALQQMMGRDSKMDPDLQAAAAANVMRGDDEVESPTLDGNHIFDDIDNQDAGKPKVPQGPSLRPEGYESSSESGELEKVYETATQTITTTVEPFNPSGANAGADPIDELEAGDLQLEHSDGGDSDEIATKASTRASSAVNSKAVVRPSKPARPRSLPNRKRKFNSTSNKNRPSKRFKK